MDTSLPATANAVFDYQRTLLSVESNHVREGDRIRTCTGYLVDVSQHSEEDSS